MKEILRRSTEPVSGASLAVTRVVIGAIGTFSALRLLRNGWVETLFVAPTVHLRYSAMSWVPLLPGWATHLQVVVIAVAAFAVMLGWHFRWALAVFLVGFTWLEFTEASVYLNHYWFVTIAGALMLVLPMSACWSLDARRHRLRSSDPLGIAAGTVQAGAVWMLRAQVAVVYLSAGVAKLHGDWLVRGEPLAMWLPARATLPVIGDLAAPLLSSPTTALVASWGGALFDCTVVFFLLWRRTRLAAWLVAVAFHLVTWILFPIIGVFPFVMIGMSTVFFDPDWPIRLRSSIRARCRSRPAEPSPASVLQPETAECTGARQNVVAGGVRSSSRPLQRVAPRWVLVAAAVWLLVQVALPMRHLLYPGDHRWTGEGYRFGWNVMLVEKAGDVRFRIVASDGRVRRTDAAELLTPVQWRVMATEPELIRQTAHALAEAEGPGTQVRVDAFVSLNGRAPVRIIDADVDLAGEPWRLGPQPWIVPRATG